MTAETRSILELCEKLSTARQHEVMDFARFLLQQEQSNAADADDAWEQLIGDSKPRPKLDAFTKAALVESSEAIGQETD